MCTVFISYKMHPVYPLIIAGNRDEFFARPTRSFHWWDDAEGLLAGKDMQAGGMWYGMRRNGRLATLTNYRDFPPEKKTTSRGDIVRSFLMSSDTTEEFLSNLSTHDDLYSGYNLIAGTMDNLYYYSNKQQAITQLEPGIYGLSNHLLDSPWPKVAYNKTVFAGILKRTEPNKDALFTMLADDAIYPDEELPDTGIGLEWERMLSALFVKSENYGTRSSTLLMVNRVGEVYFEERLTGETKVNRFEFAISKTEIL